MKKDIMQLARSIKPIRVGLSYGGELKDPTKRAAFMNMFTPRAPEANLPAVVAAPSSAPVVKPTPSSGSVSAENPDIIAHATKALMETPLTRRKFLETSRDAVAAANQAGNISKLLTPIEPPHQIPEHIPETPKFDKIGFVENSLKGMFDEVKNKNYSFGFYDYIRDALHNYMIHSPHWADMKNVKFAIKNTLHDPKKFVENYFDHLHFTKEELDHLGKNQHLNQLIKEHREDILPGYSRMEWNDMQEAAREGKKEGYLRGIPDKEESTGGRIAKSEGGDVEPSILDNEPKIELPNNLKELLSWKKDHAPAPAPASEHKPTMDEVFTSPQSGYEGATPIMMPSSLQEILKWERAPHKSEGGELDDEHPDQFRELNKSVAQSPKMIHNPPIIGHALNKIRSRSRDRD